jgi:hypothetical protein
MTFELVWALRVHCSTFWFDQCVNNIHERRQWCILKLFVEVFFIPERNSPGNNMV